MWFCFDGESFEVFASETEARHQAELAMEEWRDDASDCGWDELASQVCYGQVTHAVNVEHIPVTDDNRHTVPRNREGLERHHLEPVVSDGETLPPQFRSKPNDIE